MKIVITLERLATAGNFSSPFPDRTFKAIYHEIETAYGEQFEIDWTQKAQLDFLQTSPLKKYFGKMVMEGLLPMWSMRGARLQDIDLSKAHLYRAILSNANLARSNLRCANLIEADLREANLYKADLSHVKLNEAVLTWSILNKCDLTGANLAHANLCAVNAKKANFSLAKLYKAELCEGAFLGANFRGAFLEGANLEYANMRNTIYDKYTIFPKGFDPEEAGMRQEGA